ncbi:MAG: hypothetical protein AABZ12_07840 [Planctomycetota bacterium]
MADYWINPNNCRVAAENARPAVEQNGLRRSGSHRHADRFAPCSVSLDGLLSPTVLAQRKK